LASPANLGLDPAGDWKMAVTIPSEPLKVAEIEGDLEPFARAAYRMMFEGARHVTIAAGKLSPGRAIEDRAGKWRPAHARLGQAFGLPTFPHSDDDVQVPTKDDGSPTH